VGRFSRDSDLSQATSRIRLGVSCANLEASYSDAVANVRKYAYWSDRRIRAFSGDNDLGIYKRAWKFSIGIPKLLTFEVNDDRRTKSRDQIAKSTLDFLGSSAVEDFAKSSRVEIAKGRGSVEFANYSGGHNGVVTYTEVTTSAGERVGVCLFGSLDNMADWAGAKDDFAAGWSSSAWYAVGDLLRSRGVVKRSQWDDDEQLSVEVLKVATEQGKTAASVPGEPWTRGYTLSRADDAEWVAEIFMDTRLTPGRWADLPASVDRILTGALMWVRTGPESITRYSKLRREVGSTLF
jgi:hypothetical protein